MNKTLLCLAVTLMAAVALQAQDADSLAALREAEAANRAALSAYAADVKVVATRRVPRKDFQLWYGHLADRGWASDGNYYPAEVEVLYFARPNEDGSFDIVCSQPGDSTRWSSPVPFCDEAVSPGNEIFPMLSPDGKRLYFSSDGLFGMGGYDLYEATWDPQTKKWGHVRNLGAPFNSPADDLLFCDTEDGRYSVFASNRACGKDSIVIYVLRQETPVAEKVDAKRAAALAQLKVNAPEDGYPFVHRSFGPVPRIEFEEPVSNFDYTFKVGETGAFAEKDALPSGLVYQIQLFVVSSRPTIKQLKGVSPVFSHPQRSGKTMYAAGLFRTYADAEAALAAVRKAGHKNAIIVAFEDGKTLSLAKARQKESSVKVITEEVRIVK